MELENEPNYAFPSSSSSSFLSALFLFFLTKPSSLFSLFAPFFFFLFFLQEAECVHLQARAKQLYDGQVRITAELAATKNASSFQVGTSDDKFREAKCSELTTENKGLQLRVEELEREKREGGVAAKALAQETAAAADGASDDLTFQS